MTTNGINPGDYSSVFNQYQTSGLQQSIGGINVDNSTDAEMMNACKEFETYMIEQIYKSMEKTVMKADEEENDYEQYFGDMRIQQYAQSVMDQGGLGLAQQLYEGMKRNTTTIIEE